MRAESIMTGRGHEHFMIVMQPLDLLLLESRCICSKAPARAGTFLEASFISILCLMACSTLSSPFVMKFLNDV